MQSVSLSGLHLLHLVPAAVAVLLNAANTSGSTITLIVPREEDVLCTRPSGLGALIGLNCLPLVELPV